MKRMVLTVFSLLLVFALCACSSGVSDVPETENTTVATTEEVTEATQPSEETVPVPEPDLPVVDFTALLQEVSAQHVETVASETALDSIAKYLIEDPETVDLLTKEEMQELMKQAPSPESLTYEQAVYDLDVLFRAFRSAYGAYYYFGEEAFQTAQAEVLAWLEGKTSVPTFEFGQTVSGTLSFLQDAHSSVGDREYEEDLRYEYFYTDLLFAQDEKGCYQYIGGEKWYVESFSDSTVRIAPTLTADGELLYSPVLFCTMANRKDSSVILQDASGQEKEVPLHWQLSEAYGPSYRTPDFKLLEENGIAYLSLRCFDNMYEKGELAQFVASGKQVRDAKLIIFDIRSNGGGNDRFADQWIKNFSGKDPQYNRACSSRISPLRNAYLKNSGMPAERGKVGTFRQVMTKGKQISNEIPIIVLVDDTCGSSGEGMLNNLRCLDNVMIIGSNSAGYQMCGNIMNMWLPNSKAPVTFGVSLMLNLTEENVDFKGYEPDVWCNPADALDRVLNMLLRYELTDADTWQNLSSNPLLQRPVNMVLHWLDFEVMPDSIFGSISDSGTDIIPVSADGEPISDYTVTTQSPELLEAGVAEDGNLCLTRLKPFGGNPVPVTITYNDMDYTYYCVDSTWVPN